MACRRAREMFALSPPPTIGVCLCARASDVKHVGGVCVGPGAHECVCVCALRACEQNTTNAADAELEVDMGGMVEKRTDCRRVGGSDGRTVGRSGGPKPTRMIIIAAEQTQLGALFIFVRACVRACAFLLWPGALRRSAPSSVLFSWTAHLYRKQMRPVSARPEWPYLYQPSN